MTKNQEGPRITMMFNKNRNESQSYLSIRSRWPKLVSLFVSFKDLYSSPDLFMEPWKVMLIYLRAVSNGFSMKCRLVLMVERRRLLPTIKMSTRAGGK